MSENRFAVLIGNSKYPDDKSLLDLRCPENDAEGLGGILRSSSHGEFKEVIVLSNPSHHEASRQIHSSLSRASKDDLVLIYYSGHGKLNRLNNLYLATSNTVVEALEVR